MNASIQLELQYDDSGCLTTLSTVGRAAKGKPELLLERLPEMSAGPRKCLILVMETLAHEVQSHDLGDGTVVSVGDYGHVRLEAGSSTTGGQVLFVRDVEAGAEDASAFIARLMALVGFSHMDSGASSDALECFDVALKLQPNDAVLYQARASVKHDLLVKRDPTSSPAVLTTGVFEDLLRSIELAPDRPEVYRDLLAMLQAFRPLKGDQAGHRQWVSQVVKMALSHQTYNPSAIVERQALERFARE